MKVTSYEVAGTVDWKGVAHELKAVIPADVIARHQTGSSVATRFSVDASYDESQAKPEPLPRIRQKVDALNETVEEPSQFSEPSGSNPSTRHLPGFFDHKTA